jgi:hypothetical protein
LFNGSCNNICSSPETCATTILQYCPPLFEFPAQPIAWNNVHLFYSSNRTYPKQLVPDYICFDEQSCNSWPFVIHVAKVNKPSTLLSCQMINNISFVLHSGSWDFMLRNIRSAFQSNCALTMTDAENSCPETTQFRCGKKCLSKHRLVDNVRDCIDNMDETYNDSCGLNDKHRILCEFNRMGAYVDQCITRVFAINVRGELICTEKNNLPHFPTLCDSYVEYTETINGTKETDETHCEEWLCNTQYTRCDDIWNCLNGEDEIDCPQNFCKNVKGHPCIVWNNSQAVCLPISRAGDGIIDCVGATDERHLCRDTHDNYQTAYRCWNNHTNDEQITSE